MTTVNSTIWGSPLLLPDLVQRREGFRVGPGFVLTTLAFLLIALIIYMAGQPLAAAVIAGVWALGVVLVSPRAGVALVLCTEVWDIVSNPETGSGYEWVSVGRVLTILVVASYGLRWLFGRRPRIIAGRRAVLLLTGFVLWGMFTVLWAFDQPMAIWTVIKLVIQLGLLIVGADLLTDRKLLSQVFLMTAVGGVIGGMFMLYGDATVRSTSEFRLAVGGIGINSVAVSVGTAVMAAMGLVMLRRSPLMIAIAIGCTIVLMLVVLRTGTRSVLLGIPIAVVAGAAVGYWRKFHKLLLISVVVGVISGGSLYWASTSDFVRGKLRDRLFSSFETETFESNVRLTLWLEALQFYVRNPLGVGAGNESVAVALTRGGYGPLEAHNSFVSVLIEYNVIGLGLFSLAIFFTGWSALRIRDPALRAAATMMFVFAVLQALKGSIQENRLLWLPLMIVLAMAECDMRARAKGEVPGIGV